MKRPNVPAKTPKLIKVNENPDIKPSAAYNVPCFVRSEGLPAIMLNTAVA